MKTIFTLFTFLVTTSSFAGGRNITIDEVKGLVGNYTGKSRNYPSPDTACNVQISLVGKSVVIKVTPEQGITIKHQGTEPKVIPSFEVKRKVNYILNQMDTFDGSYHSLTELVTSWSKGHTTQSSLKLSQPENFDKISIYVRNYGHTMDWSGDRWNMSVDCEKLVKQ